MHKLFMILIFTPFVAGCASQEKYERYVRSWVGKPETELILKKGVPNGVYEVDNKKYLTYQYQNVQSGNGSIITFRCDTTYVIEDKVIIDWSYKGNACRM